MEGGDGADRAVAQCQRIGALRLAEMAAMHAVLHARRRFDEGGSRVPEESSELAGTKAREAFPILASPLLAASKSWSR
jgi:hypothetical protein